MIGIEKKEFSSKTAMYQEMLSIAASYFEGINYNISILSNASAFLNMFLQNINWVGFYLNQDNKLILGPFQGQVACIEIPFNKGVCGACATTKKTVIVDNVHQFKGHIACDSASLSEIVIPIILNDELYGVLDIDSPKACNFDIIDKDYLEKFVSILAKKLKLS